MSNIIITRAITRAKFVAVGQTFTIVNDDTNLEHVRIEGGTTTTAGAFIAAVDANGVPSYLPGELSVRKVFFDGLPQRRMAHDDDND